MQKSKRQSKWAKTKFANLVRYGPNGGYYARLRIGGKLVWRSLKTTTISIAKLRLADLAKAERVKAQVDPGQAGKLYGRSQADPVRLKLPAK